MLYQDLFVGVVSIVVGLVLIAAALANWDRWYAARKVRWLVSSMGRTAARIVYAVLGLAMIALGCAIALGFRADVFSQ